jgi:hypothetical protein
MRRTDAQVRAVEKVISCRSAPPCGSSRSRRTPRARRRKRRSCSSENLFGGMEGSWDDLLREACLAVYYGFRVPEIVLGRAPGRDRDRQGRPRNPELHHALAVGRRGRCWATSMRATAHAAPAWSVLCRPDRTTSADPHPPGEDAPLRVRPGERQPAGLRPLALACIRTTTSSRPCTRSPASASSATSSAPPTPSSRRDHGAGPGQPAEHPAAHPGRRGRRVHAQRRVRDRLVRERALPGGRDAVPAPPRRQDRAGRPRAVPEPRPDR